jgi:hypothetical protein
MPAVLFVLEQNIPCAKYVTDMLMIKYPIYDKIAVKFGIWLSCFPYGMYGR